MTLTWKKHTALSPSEVSAPDSRKYHVYRSECHSTDDASLKTAVTQCIDKSVSYLSENIDEQSQYYLCEWNLIHPTLTIVVTDDKKENDGPIVIKCYFNGLDELAHADEHADNIRFLISNYLTTCSGFMRYSLIAVFNTGERSDCSLL
ncbi:hypothetical protein [Agaribacterium sp. ZY112]|uniref:hypothetical protein n=1 Tax=Agaribacterium sp. ZY112 TaxID=3233574 RepID=UPI003526352D